MVGVGAGCLAKHGRMAPRAMGIEKMGSLNSAEDVNDGWQVHSAELYQSSQPRTALPRERPKRLEAGSVSGDIGPEGTYTGGIHAINGADY